MALNEFRVFGPPGTGKTTYLSHEIGRAAASYGSENVLVASFTVAAAKEIASRNVAIDPANMGTLHSICYRALDRPPVAAGKLKEWNEAYPHLALSDEGGGDSDDSAAYRGRAPGDDLSNEYQIMRSKMVPREHWRLGVASFAAAWEDWKQQTGSIDFTDMIELAYQDVERAPGDPAVGFFDEVQDFVPLELALVRKWGSHLDFIILAGDDDQAVYSFKGATPDAFLNPPLAAKNKRILSQSYRLPRAVKDYAEAWVQKLAVREPKAFRARDADGSVGYLPACWKQPEALLRAVEEQVAAGRTVMVLATCGYMLGPTIKALRTAGIPFHNPWARKRGDWNPLAARRGTSTVDRLLAFLRPDVAAWPQGMARMWTYGDLQEWTELLNTRTALKTRAKGEIRAAAETRGHAEASIAWLLEHALEEEHLGRALDLDTAWLLEHALAAKKRTLEYPVAVVNRAGGAALREPPRVTVGTVHSVKGAEADVVILFPDLSTAGMRELHAGDGGRDAVTRCFYVGMTRAREALLLCKPESEYAVAL